MARCYLGLLLFFLVNAVSVPLRADEVQPPVRVVTAITSTTVGDSPFELLNGHGQLHTAPDAQSFKLSYFFDEPVTLQKVEVESCEKPFSDGLDFYFNFDQLHVFAEGGQKILSAPISQLAGTGLITSVTINFNKNSGICLGAVRFLRGAKAVATEIPELLSAVVKRSGSLLEIKFPVERNIAQIKFWLSQPILKTVVAYSATLALTGDGDQSETIKVTNLFAKEPLTLKTSLIGKNLQIKIQKLADDELLDRLTAASNWRFFDGKKWFMVSPLASEQELQQDLKSKFEKSGLTGILDHNLITQEEVSSENWKLRLRSDGTFFLRGLSEDVKAAGSYYGLGTFEIKANSTPNGLVLTLKGVKKASSIEMDSDRCAWLCHQKNFTLPKENLISETISVEAAPNNIFFVRNRSSKPTQTIPFFPLRMKITSVDE